MRWLIGEMLPPAISEELNAMGHDAVNIAETELTGSSDEAVYAEALANDRIVVTENASDFSMIAAQRLGMTTSEIITPDLPQSQREALEQLL